MAADIEDGRMAAADDLLAIESIFDQIGEMFDRIEAFRRQLEARVRNTIRYAERAGRDSSAGPATWCGAWMPYCGTAGTTRRQSNGASSRCGRPGRSTIRRRPGSRAVPSKQESSPSRRRIRCMICGRSSASSTSLASRPAPRMSDDSSSARCRHSRPGKPASWKSIPWTTFSPSIAPADMR